jgi:hypothetical protein
MDFIGLVFFCVLLGLAKTANYLNLGPRWLRQFRIDKHTIY